MRGALWIPGLIACLILAPAMAVSEDAPSTADCLDCHGVDGVRPADEKPDGMSVYLSSWKTSAHGDLDCTDCHTTVTSLDHDPDLPPADCSSCHDDVLEAWELGMHGREFASGDAAAPTCATCHDPHVDLPSSNPASPLHRTNLAALCTKCHGDQNGVGARRSAVPHPAQSYARGAHARAMAAGNEAAATCSDCHDSHAVLRARNPLSKVNYENVSSTCGACHQEIRQDYEASVHGLAVAAGASGSPTCNSCHGEHAVLNLGEAGLSMVVANETCESCHNSPALARRYGLPEDAVASYEDSYHGRATRGGLAQAAGCTSCHGVHRILASNNPLSTINSNNLLQTCRSCHPKATESFAQSYAHAPKRLTSQDEAVGWVRSIYLWIIGIVIGGMLLHNLLVFIKDIRQQYVLKRKQRTHQRFNRGEVVQHLITLVSFIVLVITGMALKYDEAMWVRPLTALGMDEPLRRVIHRTAGVVMIAGSIYHLIYLVSARGREQMRQMMPKIGDVRDFFGNMSHKLGRAAHEPRFQRFSYMEKAEYWALMWGTLVMVVTGLILWFPEQLHGPSWLVRVSEAIHFYEAWLAMLAIIIWHFFYVMFRPGVFPVSFTMVDGKMPLEEMRHEHRGEYDQLYEGEEPEPDDASRRNDQTTPGS
jgi:cytochrome b subunit of formate dehydrogenase